MRRIVLALAFCFAISPLAVFAQTTTHPPVTKHKAKKVKAHKAPKAKKAKAAKHKNA